MSIHGFSIENFSKWGLRTALVVSVLSLTACATIPQQTVDLSKGISTGLNANQKLVDDLIDANIQRDINIYRTAHRQKVWEKVAGIVTAELLAQRNATPADLLAGKVKFTAADHQAVGRVQHIIDQQIENKIRAAWESARATSKANTKLLVEMNSVVTANLEAHRTLQVRQQAILGTVGDLVGIDIGRVESIVTDVLSGDLESLVQEIAKEPEGQPAS